MRKLFCKLSFAVVVFLLTVRDSSGTPSTVNFNVLQNQVDSNVHTLRDAVRLSRSKRSVETSSKAVDQNCEAQKVNFEGAIAGGKRLEDTHTFSSESKFSLALAWAGKNDDGKLVVLTSEFVKFVSESTLWRSTDHGRTWADISSKVDNKVFRKDDGLQRNPHDPSYVYLVSYENFLYKSEDGGDTWKRVDLPQGTLIEEELIFHSDPLFKDHVMVISSKRQLFKTTDNFNNFKLVRDDMVRSAHWGNRNVDLQAKKWMYILYDKNLDRPIFPFLFGDDKPLTYELHRSEDGDSWEVKLRNVVDFGMQGDFLYASVYKEDNPDTTTERLMKVSNDGGDTWNEAQLPTITSDRFFSVLDMSEHLIFMHVDNPGDTGHGTLYTSSSKGIFFSESLQRHLYPNFNSITDFYKVPSMRGTFIASQLSEDNSIHSVITFNVGGDWQPLAKPEGMACKDDAEKCSLQIQNIYSIHRGVKAFPPLATEDAIGIILVNAHAAKNLQTTDPDVFITSDGGYTWRKALDGPHSYAILDSGGIIVAISLKDETPRIIKFSTDEGRCWHEYEFTNQTIHHTGLLTEPGGKSMTVAIWGYTMPDKKWTANVIDFADVVTKQCASGDYEDWTAHPMLRQDENKGVEGCLLGKRVLFRRLKPDSWCYNGYNFEPSGDETLCTCTFEDYECDYGYYRAPEQEVCKEQTDFQGKEIDVCFRGHEERIVSKGYRKIPGDVCKDGFQPTGQYINLTKECSGRILPSEPQAVANEKQVDKTQNSSNTLVITIVAIALIVLAVAVSYFGYKMVLLRRHKVVYRYSMLSQNADKDVDDEIERTLTDPSAAFGDTSDEEELPAEPRINGTVMNGHVRQSRPQVRGFHDDSDDDMLQ